MPTRHPTRHRTRPSPLHHTPGAMTRAGETTGPTTRAPAGPNGPNGSNGPNRFNEQPAGGIEPARRSTTPASRPQTTGTPTCPAAAEQHKRTAPPP
jgi:hypothetical protein